MLLDGGSIAIFQMIPYILSYLLYFRKFCIHGHPHMQPTVHGKQNPSGGLLARIQHHEVGDETYQDRQSNKCPGAP